MRFALILLFCGTASAADLPERFLADFAAATGQSSLLDAGVPAAPKPAAGVKLDGRLVLTYEAGRTSQAKKWERILKEDKMLDEAVAEINGRYRLPYDLTVVAQQCGEANAWYKSEERKIIICYEEPAATAKLLKGAGKPQKKADVLALGDLLHTFYHELGHALIDVLKLPAVGREEDAVDQFATLTLLRFGEKGEIAAQIAAMQFLLSHKQSRKAGEPLAYWDEHSFNKQRYYDVLCLIYGKDPDKFDDLVPKKLPQARADQCPAEYERLDAAWQTLLTPHLKPSSSSAGAAK